MRAGRARLRRLRRLERVRAIARQAAALEAASAESTLAQLQALAERTRLLAAEYAGRNEARDGASLRQAGRFAQGLQNIHAATAGDVAHARGLADARLADLAAAERRRASAGERVADQAREIARNGDTVPLGARRGIGTGLE